MWRGDKAIDRNLAFLQGAETEAVDLLRRLIRRREAGTVRITDYRKDRSKFTRECELRPIRDAGGTVTHFFVIQRAF